MTEPHREHREHSTDYEPIAQEYQESKHAEWRTFIEVPSFLGTVGDVEGRSVLDLACGEGFYTRELRRRGAARVVGVDSSPAMISLALEQEQREGLGVEYLVDDVRGLDLGQRFDLVVAAFLLNYAADDGELSEMAEAVVRHLHDGSRFVTVNANPALGPERIDYRQYGFERLVPAELPNGATYVFRNHQGGSFFDITVHQLDRATHERVLGAAGLVDLRWLDPWVSPEGLERRGSAHWELFLQRPPVILLEARAYGVHG